MTNLKSMKKHLYLITSTNWKHIYIIILTLDGIIIDNFASRTQIECCPIMMLSSFLTMQI